MVSGDSKRPRRCGRHGSGLTLFSYRNLSVAIGLVLDTLVRRVTICEWCKDCEDCDHSFKEGIDLDETALDAVLEQYLMDNEFVLQLPAQHQPR